MSELQRGMRATMGILDDYMGDESYDDDNYISYDDNYIDDLVELTELYYTCKFIQNTSSTTLKKDILIEEENDKSFKQVLKFLLDPNIVTGISKKKIEKKVDIAECSFFTNIIKLIDYLQKHNTGTDKDIACCQAFLNYWNNSQLDEMGKEEVEDGFSTVDTKYDNEKLQDFIKSIITKSLKLGIDVKTANKVYGKDFIPMLNVMLGTSIEKCKIPQGTWFSISQKLNGSRCFYYKGKLYTRQGKVYTGCEHIIKDVEKLNEFHNEDWVYDGELILKDNSLTDSEKFQKGVGIANSDNKNKEELKLVIFDVLPTKEFENGKSQFVYSSRKAILNNIRNGIEKLNLSNIEIVPVFYEGTDQNKIWEWLDYAEENDMEGVMVNLDTPYECKRTKNLIKVKKFFDTDLRCIGIEQGSGKYANTLGAIVCDYKGNELRVGSGFTDEQRDYYWNNPSEIIGKTVTIKYKEETKNKNGGQSLQFPVWVTTRFDK